MQQIQISIPKPCHQDWNQMTPEERGRFCSMCQKTVLDFSQQSKEEILEFINAHRNEHLCGRFRSEQLAEFSRIEVPTPVYHSRLSFINMFLVALLFCFGSALFSCNIPANQLGEIDAVAVNGLIEARVPETPKQSVPDTNAVMVMGDTIVMGDFSVPEEFVVGKYNVQDQKSRNKEHVKGKMAIQPENADTTELPSLEVSTHQTREIHTVGLMVMKIGEPITEETDSAAEDIIDSIVVAKTEATIPVNVATFFSSVYPNPSNGLLNIEFQPDKEQYVQLDLFDAVGNLVRNFIPRQLFQPERQTLKVDVSDQPPGIYLLRISTGDKVKTERVVIAAR